MSALETMRTLLSVLALMFGLAASGPAAAHEPEIARPGGVFASAPAPNPDACARACSEDALCMSWTHAAGQCELKAVVPAPIVAPGAVSGIAARAPLFAHVIAPAPALKAVSVLVPPVEAARITMAQALPEPSDELLGGPEERVALRRRLPDEPR